MRIVAWIIRTLVYRSWLIFGGVALGMLARYAWPDASDQPAVLPEAAETFEQIHFSAPEE